MILLLGYDRVITKDFGGVVVGNAGSDRTVHFPKNLSSEDIIGPRIVSSCKKMVVAHDGGSMRDVRDVSIVAVVVDPA